MRIDIVTIFPEYFDGPLRCGTIRIAQEKGIVDIRPIDLREYAEPPHRKVDDSPFGGGPGMVMCPEPFFAAVEAVLGVENERDARKCARIVLLSPRGQRLSQDIVADLAAAPHLVLLCGRYEGVDERVARYLATDELSIGDYVMAGGEAAALVVCETVARLQAGAVGEPSSVVEESFQAGLLEYPQYTRPAEYRGYRAPDALLSGNHRIIASWRRRRALLDTLERRPDLLRQAPDLEAEALTLKSQSILDDSPKA